jgi:peptidoglycan-N-acetylglucosamine deacetylase
LAKSYTKRLIKTIVKDVCCPTVGCKLSDPMASLTFDDGPHPESTVDVVKILKRYRIQATFFMVGELADKYPEIVRMVYENGHTIANHSWDHPDFKKINFKQKLRQIKKCNKVLRRYSIKYFRPPWGRYDTELLLAARMLGYRIILWNLHADDWTARDEYTIADTLIQNIQFGKIILLHDNIYRSHSLSDEEKSVIMYDRTIMLKGLEIFLNKMRGNYTFVPLSTLLNRGIPIIK